MRHTAWRPIGASPIFLVDDLLFSKAHRSGKTDIWPATSPFLFLLHFKDARHGKDITRRVPSVMLARNLQSCRPPRHSRLFSNALMSTVQNGDTLTTPSRSSQAVSRQRCVTAEQRKCARGCLGVGDRHSTLRSALPLQAEQGGTQALPIR